MSVFSMLLMVVSCVAQELCTSQHGVQCANQDIGFQDNVHDHMTCCNACQAHPGCNAWSWDYYDFHCHLHAACTKISNGRYHSGIGSPGPSPPGPSPPGPSPPSPSPPSPPGPPWTLNTFHWNVHHQCGQDGNNACQAAARARFGELAREVNAQIAVGIEIRGAKDAMGGYHASGEYEDAVSVMVAPGWTVHKSGGGEINSGWGARGLAVMLVTPPHRVHGCPQLCVMGVHPGHSHITGGKGIVDGVCGSSVAERCSIAMGDWNTGANEVRGGSMQSWASLIGGYPTVLAPDSKTCCHPSTCCNFDHVGTNIAGAHQGNAKVWPYQLTSEFSMKEEHMPVSLSITLPGGGYVFNNMSTVIV